MTGGALAFVSLRPGGRQFLRGGIQMQGSLKAIRPLMAGLLLTAGTSWMTAQITNEIKAHIDHSFVIADKTLPPGDYTFRIQGDTTGSLMVARNAKGDNVAEFAVRQSVDNRSPRHSEVIFKKYGNTEFLNKIYEGGNPNGVAVSEISKEEARLVKEGRQGMEHTEEQH